MTSSQKITGGSPETSMPRVVLGEVLKWTLFGGAVVGLLSLCCH